MEFREYFPIWDKLTGDQQQRLSARMPLRAIPKGTVIHNGHMSCTGIILVKSGQLRTYMLSDEGREITLYRLFEGDMCLLSAPCMLKSIQFDVTVETEKDTEVWIIPPNVYQQVMEQSAALAGYTLELMATRFSEVMWLMEQVMWKSLDKRIAAFLLEESAIEEADTLKITHEAIANHLGSPREVITRMLRYFQSEGMVRLSRGAVTLTDMRALHALTEE